MMMTSLAQVRQVLTGHSDRALVIAVDAEGHVLKLEMPTGAVRDVKERETMLVLSWSFHAAPVAINAAASSAELASPASSEATARPVSTEATARNADDEFHALMSRPATAPATPVTAAERSLAEQLAERLGLTLERT